MNPLAIPKRTRVGETPGSADWGMLKVIVVRPSGADVAALESGPGAGAQCQPGGA
jgi:hypothetical protein